MICQQHERSLGQKQLLLIWLMFLTVSSGNLVDHGEM